MRRFLIWILSKLVKVKVEPDGKITDISQDKVLFISPDFTKEKFEASESIDDFITKIHNKII